jgi:hypothetical protein
LLMWRRAVQAADFGGGRMKIVRIIIGIVVGIVLGIGCVAAGDWINHQLFAPPAAEEWVAYARDAPFYRLVGLPLAYAAAAFAGAFAAAKIAARVWAGWIAGGVVVAGTIGNLFMIAHPLWMTLAFIVLVPAGAWFGARLAR